MAINEKSFPEQAWFFAKCSDIAYLKESVGCEVFSELGFHANFIDHKGSQAYWLHNDDDLVIVCRGTEPKEWQDIRADLEALLVASSTGIGKVHKGFKISVAHIWPNLQKFVTQYGSTRKVWCTGHSLGAAMATILAYKLQRSEVAPIHKPCLPMVRLAWGIRPTYAALRTRVCYTIAS